MAYFSYDRKGTDNILASFISAVGLLGLRSTYFGPTLNSDLQRTIKEGGEADLSASLDIRII